MSLAHLQPPDATLADWWLLARSGPGCRTAQLRRSHPLVSWDGENLTTTGLLQRIREEGDAWCTAGFRGLTTLVAFAA
jgi:hypothetical protein